MDKVLSPHIATDSRLAVWRVEVKGTSPRHCNKAESRMSMLIRKAARRIQISLLDAGSEIERRRFALIRYVRVAGAFCVAILIGSSRIGAQTCTGNACGSVYVTSHRPHGFNFRNTSNRPIAVSVRFAFGGNCMAATNFSLAPRAVQAYGNGVTVTP